MESGQELATRFRAVRDVTEALAAPLSAEDQQLQSMPSASPVKWHRAHTTWFFETFLLAPAGVAPVDERYGFLFNSYYDAVGDRVARPKRGMMSRPTADEVGVYRRVVDDRVEDLLNSLSGAALARAADIIALGLAHEEQHQELILTDVLHALSQNPLGPAYRDHGAVAASSSSSSPSSPPSKASSMEQRWHGVGGGVVEIGAGDGFSFDNELPRHKVFLRDYELAARPITVGEVRAFIADGGYTTPSLWLSQGYELARAERWTAPLYVDVAGGFRAFSLRGWRVPDDDEPASHLSFYEAEAIARYLGARLPTEHEWEHAAGGVSKDEGNFADGALVPSVVRSAELTRPARLFGDVWEWTRSSYEPYPGYVAAAGALGEYNGKFMAQQMVLRGGSCFTPRRHVRASYRNFWAPETRFQMTGARLARDA